ncbi:IS4 transposase [Paenibacillus polymyxa]|uniref:transposase n=1 Tax=Paenibacillus polymyxa TaxID=1406 RepID=UPI00278E8961|nr:IS4 transposase [Paenibacillus polymyxa]
MQVTAEQIAQMYKARWQMEVFFRWIKQHLNIPTLFGATPNAVYGQLFCALIVYVLLKYYSMLLKRRGPTFCHTLLPDFLDFSIFANCLVNGLF